MTDPIDAKISNVLGGEVAGNSVQAGAVYGDVHFGRKRWPPRVRMLVILIAAALLSVSAGVGVALLRSRSKASSVGLDPVSVAVDLVAPPCETTWVLKRRPSEIDWSVPVADAVSWRAWSPAKDGFSGSPGWVLATVQGKSDAQVVLTGLRVFVQERHEPVSGTTLDVACGGPIAFRWLAVDLDAEPPRVTPGFSEDFLPPDAPEREKTPIRFPYEVSIADAETFLIEATTARCYCTWTAELSWASEGRTGIVRIDDHGKPFGISSSTNTVACTLGGLSGGPPKCG